MKSVADQSSNNNNWNNMQKDYSMVNNNNGMMSYGYNNSNSHPHNQNAGPPSQNNPGSNFAPYSNYNTARFNKPNFFHKERQPANSSHFSHHQGSDHPPSSIHSHKDEDHLSETNLYLRGLPEDTTDDTLRKLCEAFGKIVSTKAIMEKGNNQCRGYGFVDFENPAEAKDAVKLLNDQNIQAQMAKISPSFAANQPDPTNLYIANLPLDFSEDMLKTLCESEGALVVSTRVLRKEDGGSRCVGFARLDTRERCEQIIEKYNGKMLDNAQNPLLVKLADFAKKPKKGGGGNYIMANSHMNPYYYGGGHISNGPPHLGSNGHQIFVPQGMMGSDGAHYMNYAAIQSGPDTIHGGSPAAGPILGHGNPQSQGRVGYISMAGQPHYSSQGNMPQYQVISSGAPTFQGNPLMPSYQGDGPLPPTSSSAGDHPPHSQHQPTNQSGAGYYQNYQYYQGGQSFVPYGGGMDGPQMHHPTQQTPFNGQGPLPQGAEDHPDDGDKKQ
uniref:RRM domain-containing protein n=1 Tax=Rhabditophanes sp. KR3021 TaxID=114890 RepID=A0AC35TPR1_9BILA